MFGFIRRFFGAVLAASVFAGALALLLRFQPEGLGGWAVLAGLILLAAIIAIVIYRWFARGPAPGPQADDRSGDGYMSGLGFGSGSRRRDEGDDMGDGMI